MVALQSNTRRITAPLIYWIRHANSVLEPHCNIRKSNRFQFHARSDSQQGSSSTLVRSMYIVVYRNVLPLALFLVGSANLTAV